MCVPGVRGCVGRRGSSKRPAAGAARGGVGGAEAAVAMAEASPQPGRFFCHCCSVEIVPRLPVRPGRAGRRGAVRSGLARPWPGAGRRRGSRPGGAGAGCPSGAPETPWAGAPAPVRGIEAWQEASGTVNRRLMWTPGAASLPLQARKRRPGSRALGGCVGSAVERPRRGHCLGTLAGEAVGRRTRASAGDALHARGRASGARFAAVCTEALLPPLSVQRRRLKPGVPQLRAAGVCG